MRKAVRWSLSLALVLISGNFLISAQVNPDDNGAKNNVLPPPKQIEEYRIGYLDVLEIQVFKHPELNSRVSVNPDGTIFIPRATKPIQAYCKTVRELAEAITEDYKSFLRNPFVNVIVADQRSQSFGVIGAVEKPGNFFVNRRVPLLELLSFAGGPSKESGSRLIVARLGSSSACRLSTDTVAASEDLILMTFRIKDVQEGKKNLIMQPGDVVSVLESDVIYVYGNVNKQGEVKIREPRTLRQIIASAEGFSPNAKKDRIRVLRQKPDSIEWEEFVYNIKDIDSGKIPDPFLLPNDIVAVSEDKAGKIVGSIARGLSGGLGNLPIFIR